MLRTQLARGDRSLSGLFISGATPDLVEMAARQHLDYVVLDAEHSMLNQDLPELVRTARLAGIPSIVRLPRAETAAMAQVLDLGANGVLVPGVQNAGEIERVVNACRYPPEGGRGLAFSVPAAGYGLDDAAGYLARARAETVVLVQIETSEAVHHVSDWAHIAGVDGFFVGPTDLSMALGEEGQPGPRFERAMTHVVEALEAAGRPWGIFAGSSAARRQWVARGAHMVATAVPLVVSDGLRRWLGATDHA